MKTLLARVAPEARIERAKSPVTAATRTPTPKLWKSSFATAAGVEPTSPDYNARALVELRD